MKSLNVVDQFQRLLEQVQENALESERPLGFKDSCNFLGVSPSKLYKLVHYKQIEYFKPSGGKLYFDKKVLLEYMRSGRIKSAQQIDEEAANYLINK